MCEQKIFIDVEYLYIPRIPHNGKGEYRARIVAYVPEGDEMLDVTRPIARRYQSASVAFFTEPLRPTWGWRSDERLGYRYNYQKFYEPDLQTLKKRVKEYIDREIEKLKEVVHKNEHLEPEHYEHVI